MTEMAPEVPFTGCTKCGASVTNGLTLCARCQTTLSVSLVNVAAYHTDVLRIQPGEKVKVRSTYKSTPPPSLEPPADWVGQAADEAGSTIAKWTTRLGHTTAGAPIDTVARCAWLERNTAAIATHDWASQMIREVLDTERQLRRILDKADTGWYAGRCNNVLAPERTHDAFTCGCGCHHGQPCDVDYCDPEQTITPPIVCPRGLYATPGNNWITCPECGATWEVAGRRNNLLAEAKDEIAPIRVIAKVLVGLIDTEVSEERLAKRLDKWVERDQLASMGMRVIDGRPRRVYRIGDVWDLLMREQRPSRPAAEVEAPPGIAGSA